jgi:hypothetical protein
LVWGSLNASRNAFEKNAEVLALATLNESQDKDLERYFHHLWDAETGTVSKLDRWLAENRVRLVLPEFRFVSKAKSESFEGWLQSGLLCHKYERDQTFAKLEVTLESPLPKGRIEELFTDAGLSQDTDSKLFRWQYLGHMDGHAAPVERNWRATYFVETWLGFWTSDDCYRDCGTLFSAPNREQRQQVLSEVKESNISKHNEWTDGFIARLSRIVSGLRDQRELVSKYFKLKRTELDMDHYREKACKQLNAHRYRARNPIFEQRYTTGYAFPPMPRFRGAEAPEGGSFDDFVQDWCDSVSVSMAKTKCTSRLVRVLREQLNKKRVMEVDIADGTKLRDIIRQLWGQIGAKVKTFHREP